MLWAVGGLAAAIVAGGIIGVLVRGESHLGLVPLFSAAALFVLAGAVASRRRPAAPAPGCSWPPG
jgi:predicted cobalt transporter CbtA